MRQTLTTSDDSSDNETLSDTDSESEDSGSWDVQAPSIQPATSHFSSTSSQRWCRMATRNMTFEETSLLRGMRCADAMHCAAQIFGDVQLTANTYEQSRRVDKINMFISHNWSTPRSSKFLVLMLHYNLKAALVATAAVSLCLAAFTAMGKLPTVEVVISDEHRRRGVCCIVFGNLTFFITLFFGHELARLVRCEKFTTWMFLDKTCVHQTDQELKQKGIEHLAAFLGNAEDMIILYSEKYLQKLWTIYEVASFLMLHPGRCMTVRPLFLPKVVLAGMLISMSGFLSIWAFRHVAIRKFLDDAGFGWFGERLVMIVICVPGTIWLGFIMRGWARERAEIDMHVQNFQLKSAECFDERDRVVVQNNIIAFMKKFHPDGGLEPGELLLTAFEDLVHSQVPHLLRLSLGNVGIPYWYVVAIYGFQHLTLAMDDMGGLLFMGRGVRDLVTETLLDVVVSFTIYPCVLAISCHLLRQSLELSPIAACFLVCTSSLMSLIIGLLTYGIMLMVALRAKHSDEFVVVHFFCIAALGLATFCVYHSSASRCCARKGRHSAHHETV